MEEKEDQIQTPNLGSIIESSPSLDEFNPNYERRTVPPSTYIEQNKSITELNNNVRYEPAEINQINLN